MSFAALRMQACWPTLKPSLSPPPHSTFLACSACMHTACHSNPPSQCTPLRCPHPACPQDLTFRHYTLKLKVASDTYNDEQKVRVTVVRAEPPNFVQESKVSLTNWTGWAGSGRRWWRCWAACLRHGATWCWDGSPSSQPPGR